MKILIRANVSRKHGHPPSPRQQSKNSPQGNRLTEGERAAALAAARAVRPRLP
jgi:hypothetical protein